MNNVLFGERIHVVDDQVDVNIVTVHSEIARLISNDHHLTKASPLSRSVEPLIDPSVEPEGLVADLAFQGEVFETLFEGSQL